MPNSDHSRNEYLKALLNASKNNQANEGVLVNPSNTLGNANTDISELAVLDTKLPSKNKVPITEQIKNVDDRNFWQRTMDSINEFRLNVLEGTFNFFGGIVDAGIWLGGAVGNVFGADTKWAEEAMAYDWESQALNFMNQTNWGQHIYSGDIFNEDYWQNWADMGSAEASRENIDQVHSGSFVSDMGETGQQTYETITQGIGYILPSVLVAIGTGGASLGVQTAARATSLVGTGVSATGSGTQAALQDGADYYKAGASGLVSGAIEMGTEALSFGVGKLVGKVLGKTVSYGTRISGAQFGKAVAKLTANELGKAALEEGTEELIAELLSPFAKSVYKGGKAFNEYANPELYKQAVIAFAGGAVGGMFGSGIQSVNAKAKYTKQGVEILELTQEVAKMKQDNEGEFEKGDKADQQAIGVVEKRLGAKVKELTAKLETLKTSNPKAFDSVMKAIKNPEQAIKELEQSTGQKLTDEQKATFEKEYIGTPEQLAEKLGQSTIESVAEQDSFSLSKKLKTPTIIKIAKKGDFEMGNKGMANSEAFIDTDSYGRNIVWINPKFANRYYNIVAHEAISHGVIDTSEYNQSKLLKLADTTIKSDNLIELENGILELYEEEIKAELKTKSQAKFEKYAKNTKVFKAEKLAKWVETFVHDKKSLTRLLDTKASRSEISGLKALLSRIKKTLSPSKNAKLIKQIQNVLDKITDNQNETSEKTSTKLAPAYSKIDKIKDSIGNELTPEQQDYFKDSKVRDENGNLLVVYHGTTEKFNTFDINKAGKATRAVDKALFFTDSQSIANEFSYETKPSNKSNYLVVRTGKKGNVGAYYLDMQKPLNLSKLNKSEIEMIANHDSQGNDSNFANTIIEAINRYLDSGNHQGIKTFLDYDYLQSKGYDGIIARMYSKYQKSIDNNAIEYAVFNSNQIKSIDNKNPTDSDDIRYSRTFDSAKNKLASEEKRKKIVARLAKAKSYKNIPLAETAIIKNGYQYYVDNQALIGLQLAKNNYIDGLKDGNELINGHPINNDTTIDRFFNEKKQVKVATIKISDLYSELKSLGKDSKIIMLKVGDHSIAFQRKVLIDAFELAGFETDAKINIYTVAKKLNNFAFAPLLFKNITDNSAVIVSAVRNADAEIPSLTISNKNPNLPSDIKETLKDQEITPTKVEQPKADSEQTDGNYEMIPLFYGVDEYIERESKEQKSSQAKAKYDDKVSGVQASKDYAQHMQERVINMTTTKDVYNIMVDGIASAFGIDIKIAKQEALARQTTIAFNRLLNKPKELNKVVSGIINDILDSQIEYEVKTNENQVARPLKVTLRKHLSDLGINVNEFFNDSISILKDILLDKSNDSKVEKLRNYYQSKIRLMALQVKEYRNKGIETIQVFKTIKKIIERLEKNKLPSQRGDRQIAELEFYRQATSGIKFSNSSKGISPSSVDRIINGLRSYEPKIIEKLQWLEYNKEIEDAVTFLMASQVDGKFPNRALTLDETHAVLTIMKNIAADMRKLESKAMAERIKLTERADLEAKIVLQANKGYKSNFLQNELDAASSIDTIVGRYFGTNSATYRILYGDMYKAMDKQLLKQWEFFGEYEKLKKQHNIKDNQLNKRVEFKGEKLSLDLLLDMYIQSRTESGLATLQQGGYSIYNKGVTTHLQLSPQDIIALETILPNDMKVFGDKVLLDLYNGSLREYKANVDERIFGYKNVIEEIYYPSTKSDTSNAKFNNENDFKALDPSKTSFNQHRLNATKMSLRGMGFSERFKVYTNAITKYGETTESIKAFESLLNQFTTRADGTRATRLTLMAEAIPHFKTYIAYLQDQISGNMVDGTKTKGRMFTNIVSFTLAGNLSVVMKQTASIPSIMFEVKFSSWVKALAGAGGKIAKYRQSKAHLKQMSGILAERWGDYNLLKSKVLSENISQIAKFFGIPMARMDEAVIVVFGYAAAQYEAESLGLGRVGTPENDKAAIDILNRIVANTQSNAIPMKMSMNRAGANGFIRKALSYFSSDLQNKVSQLNMLLSEATNAKKQLEVIEKQISDNELAIEENNTKFDEFKRAHNMAEASDNAVAKLDDANAKQYYSFEQEAERLKSEKSALADMKSQKQEIIAGGGAEKALKLLFSLFLSGLMIASIEQLMARILGRKGWNENTSKDFAISLLLESTINNLPYVSTITNAIQYKADVGGYDFTLLNNLIDIVGDITNMAKTGDWELTKILLYLSDTLGMMTGIPTKNLYNIAMGIWKQVGGSGFETDAIIKGYGSSYLSSELKKAVEGNHKNKAIGYLETLLATYKVGKTSSAIQSELLTLYSNGFNALPKNFMTSYIGDDRKSVELTDSQISVFRKHYEMGNKDANDLLAINEYKTATQENRAKSISKLYDAYYSYAKAKALNLDKADSRLANLLLYTNGNVDIAKYVIYLSKLGEIQESKAKSKKELSVEYINGLSNFTKPEKLLLMVLNGYSVGEKLQNQVLSYLSAKGMSRANAMTFLNIDK